MNLKKKLPVTVLLLLFLWLIVSVYFYGQHILVYKRTPLWGRVETDEAVIILKNVVVYNHERKYYTYDEIPWYWKIGNNIDNARLRNAFVRVCYFYSRPYAFQKDLRTIKLQGIIASKNAENADNFTKHLPTVRLYGDYDVSLTRGMRYLNNDSNVYHFESYGEDIELKNNRTYKVIIKDKDSGEIIKEFPIWPDWRYYTIDFFDRDTYWLEYYKPEQTIYNFVNLLNAGRQEAAANYVYPRLKDSFPWANLDHEYFSNAYPDTEYYLGDHLGFRNVFYADLLYFKEEAGKVNQLGDEFAKQTIYFVDDVGQWRIIDVSSVELK